ncbi:MAG: hypothetical protein PHU08_00075 [Dehalococcoidales bacterium]|nr:hypothetical protein [Dehalococcoidales bacterium]
MFASLQAGQSLFLAGSGGAGGRLSTTGGAGVIAGASPAAGFSAVAGVASFAGRPPAKRIFFAGAGASVPSGRTIRQGAS